ncbi:MAG: outer membrane lipoprotein carrier protein LolA [Fibrobacteria bacterium]|nr:outer membrane lipoprotein carrier protein LolA [Fibrobacteria bacterium]
MKKAVSYFEESGSMKIDFTADMYWSATEEWRSSKGKIWFSGESKYRVFMPELEIVSNGTKLWKYSKENKQVVEEVLDGNSWNTHPSRILFEFLKCEALSHKLIKEKRQEFIEIVLIPAKGLKHYSSLIVLLNPQTGEPKKIHTVDEAENESVYTISKIKRHVKFKKKQFEFVPPKGVEVIDAQ